MQRREKGFTLIELMIVVVIIGVLAAIAIPNFIAMQDRAKEGSTKANMHAFQTAAEDYGVQNNGNYAVNASDVAAILPYLGATFNNPFTQLTTNSWEDRSSYAADPSSTPGVVSYADSSNGYSYNVKGYGRRAPIRIVLSSGQ